MKSFHQYFSNEIKELQKISGFLQEDHQFSLLFQNISELDPDLQRLLTGTAYLTAGIQKKIDEQFPEIISGLLEMVAPEYLRPITSKSIVTFTPKGNLNQGLTIKKGTRLDTKVIRGSYYSFQTSEEIFVDPLLVENVQSREVSGDKINIDQIEIKIDLKLIGNTLSSWGKNKIRFFINNIYGEAVKIIYLLNKGFISSEIYFHQSKQSFPLAEQCFDFSYNFPETVTEKSSLLPHFNWLKDYFLHTEKFLFFDVILPEYLCHQEEESFSLIFNLNGQDVDISPLKSDSFVLHAVEVENIFNSRSKPLLLKKDENEIKLEPLEKSEEIETIDVLEVKGIQTGGKERFFKRIQKIDQEDKSKPYYQVVRKETRSGDAETWLQFFFPEGTEKYEKETITSQLLCTNGKAAEALSLDSINQATIETPELVSFTNIRPLTPYFDPIQDEERLWKLLTYFSFNYITLGNIESFKTMLSQLLPKNTATQIEISNQKKIDGILDMEVHATERMLNKGIYRGQKITMKIKGNHFLNKGDIFLFGSAMDRFLASQVSMNTFTEFTIKDVVNAEAFSWKPRLGNRLLI